MAGGVLVSVQYRRKRVTRCIRLIQRASGEDSWSVKVQYRRKRVTPYIRLTQQAGGESVAAVRAQKGYSLHTRCIWLKDRVEPPFQRLEASNLLSSHLRSCPE